MAAYLILSYDISDADRFADYNPGSLPAIRETISAHGGAVIFGGPAEFLRGEGKQNVVGVKFPDAAAAKAWLDDPAYAEAKAIRLEATTDITSFLIEGRD